MTPCEELDGLRHLLLAAILDTLSSPEDAMEHFRLSVQQGLHNPDELCVPAFALYELGLLLAASEEVGHYFIFLLAISEMMRAIFLG